MVPVSPRAFLLAPIPAPLILAVLVELGAPGNNPLAAILLFFVAGSVVSYGATAFLLLPVLKLASRGRTLTTAHAAGIGAALGLVPLFPLTWMSWRSSGPNSGAPETTFTSALAEALTDRATPTFIVAGALTAALYFWLAHRQRPTT